MVEGKCRCDYIRVCEHCGKVKYLDRMKEHDCGEAWCKPCNSKGGPGHQCTMKWCPKNEDRIRRRRIFYDFETMPVEMENGEIVQKVVLAYALRCCPDCEGGIPTDLPEVFKQRVRDACGRGSSRESSVVSNGSSRSSMSRESSPARRQRVLIDDYDESESGSSYPLDNVDDLEVNDDSQRIYSDAEDAEEDVGPDNDELAQQGEEVFDELFARRRVITDEEREAAGGLVCAECSDDLSRLHVFSCIEPENRDVDVIACFTKWLFGKLNRKSVAIAHNARG